MTVNKTVKKIPLDNGGEAMVVKETISNDMVNNTGEWQEDWNENWDEDLADWLKGWKEYEDVVGGDHDHEDDNDDDDKDDGEDKNKDEDDKSTKQNDDLVFKV